MTNAYYTYGIHYPVIIEYDLDYWDCDWPNMDGLEIIYLFTE